MDVTDRIVVVTGGGRGIGRGIVLVMAEHGADVAVADLDLGNAQSVAGEAEQHGRSAMASKVDVTDPDSVSRLVQGVIGRFGRIDILVNNAGVIGAPGWGQRERADLQDWDATYEINVKGAAIVTDAVVPHMKERKYGKIVNISSIAGKRSFSQNAPYSASKAAVISLTRSSAAELAPDNINVNAICPGLLWTPMWERIANWRLTQKEELAGLSAREVFDRAIKGAHTAGSGADSRGHREPGNVSRFRTGPEHHRAVHQRQRRIPPGLTTHNPEWQCIPVRSERESHPPCPAHFTAIAHVALYAAHQNMESCRCHTLGMGLPPAAAELQGGPALYDDADEGPNGHQPSGTNPMGESHQRQPVPSAAIRSPTEGDRQAGARVAIMMNQGEFHARGRSAEDICHARPRWWNLVDTQR